MKKSVFDNLYGLWALLPKSHRNETFAILLLSVVGTLLEVLGIGLVIPAIALILDNNIEIRFPIFATLFQLLGRPTQVILIYYGLLVIFSPMQQKPCFWRILGGEIQIIFMTLKHLFLQNYLKNICEHLMIFIKKKIQVS